MRHFRILVLLEEDTQLLNIEDSLTIISALFADRRKASHTTSLSRVENIITACRVVPGIEVQTIRAHLV